MTIDSTMQLAERTAAILRAEGRADAAAILASLVSAPPKATPTVVVAGEAKRGKSSLVNSLLSRCDLSPVGSEPTTATPITFFYSEQPGANLFHYGSAAPTPVEVDRALQLATVLGNPGNEESLRAVSIGLDSPLLARLHLVDTPGVGGLDSGHAAATLQSLTDADALLFVIEALAPIRAPELEFLRRASVRIDTVVLALTKTDISRGWQTIRDDDRAVLREYAPRFADCPIIAISNKLALRGLRSDNADDAMALRQESGVADLEAALLERVADRNAVLHDANITRAALVQLGGVERACQQRAAAAASPGAAQQQMKADQRLLQQLNHDRADWPQILDAETRKLSLARQEAVARQTVDLRHRYEERLKKLTKKDYEQLPGEFTAELAALADALNETARESLAAIVFDLLADADETAALHASIAGITDHSIEEELQSLAVGTHTITHLDRLSMLSSFTAGRTLAELLSGSGLGLTASALIAPPVGLALGLGFGSLFVFQTFRNRNRQAFAAEFGPWMRDQIANAQLTVNNVFARGVIDFQAQVKKAIREVLANREREINSSIAATKRLLQAEAAERARAQEEGNNRLAAVRALKREAVRLLSDLDAGSVS